MNALGFCTLSALDRPLAAVAELAAAAGLDGVEVTARAPHLDPDASIAARRSEGVLTHARLEAGDELAQVVAGSPQIRPRGSRPRLPRRAGARC